MIRPKVLSRLRCDGTALDAAVEHGSETMMAMRTIDPATMQATIPAALKGAVL
ncbi:hypothetical protein [Novosphingobium aquimarinum]|uniref:hypothetical protein n=1 Tax=Novosphingobium aquimarinum TaxID=2682494 RepID=UPI0012EC4A2F|nr:hypothetical protein [Novosphingobium aquimarinum]